MAEKICLYFFPPLFLLYAKPLKPRPYEVRNLTSSAAKATQSIANPSLKETDKTSGKDEKSENFTPNLHQDEKRKLAQFPISCNH